MSGFPHASKTSVLSKGLTITTIATIQDTIYPHINHMALKGMIDILILIHHQLCSSGPKSWMEVVESFSP